MIEQRLLKPESYREMQTEVRLKNGEGTKYGLGLDIDNILGHRVVAARVVMGQREAPDPGRRERLARKPLA